MEQLLHMLSVLFSTPCNSPLLRHPSTCMQTHSNPEERVAQMCRDHCQYPFLRGFNYFLALFACWFPYFSSLYLQVLWPDPLASFLSLAFLLHIQLQGFGKSSPSSKMLQTSQYSIQVQHAVPNVWEQTHHSDELCPVNHLLQTLLPSKQF